MRIIDEPISQGNGNGCLWEQSSKWVSVQGHRIVKLGMLYSGYAVVDAHGLAPAGWHVPTQAEWETLIISQGGDISGGKLKSTDNWNAPNTGATNTSGFTAFGGGKYFYPYLSFADKGLTGNWWSSTLTGAGALDTMRMYSDTDYGVTYDCQELLDSACSVRFIKDDGALSGDVIDADGNTYNTVKIGNQVWMVQNWACTKFRDGTPIQHGFAAGVSAYSPYNDDINANAFSITQSQLILVNDPTHIQPKDEGVMVPAEYIDGGLASPKEKKYIIPATDGATVTFALPNDINYTFLIKVIDGGLYTEDYSINQVAKTITYNTAPLPENQQTIFYTPII